MIRYIHLNPVRAQIVSSTHELMHYPWTGHYALAASKDIAWQDTKSVLDHFGSSIDRCVKRGRDILKHDRILLE